ncbi:hypothetical protein GEMRC1_001613 [Eukaryota sp. GEM-RC1]
MASEVLDNLFESIQSSIRQECISFITQSSSLSQSYVSSHDDSNNPLFTPLPQNHSTPATSRFTPSFGSTFSICTPFVPTEIQSIPPSTMMRPLLRKIDLTPVSSFKMPTLPSVTCTTARPPLPLRPPTASTAPITSTPVVSTLDLSNPSPSIKPSPSTNLSPSLKPSPSTDLSPSELEQTEQPITLDLDSSSSEIEVSDVEPVTDNEVSTDDDVISGNEDNFSSESESVVEIDSENESKIIDLEDDVIIPEVPSKEEIVVEDIEIPKKVKKPKDPIPNRPTRVTRNKKIDFTQYFDPTPPKRRSKQSRSSKKAKTSD